MSAANPAGDTHASQRPDSPRHPKAPSELRDGERAEVCWITTDEIDRHQEIVLAKGMNDSHFKLNPLVTYNHSSWQPPIAKSQWRRKAPSSA